MAQLNLRLDERRLAALRRLAARRRTPLSWLLRDYADYLLAGGAPIAPGPDARDGADLAAIAERGGAFDWLAEEPELYSLRDGEPV